MATRAQALEAFYDGPVWKEHRDAANATMIDSDNVLLLRPARSGTAFALTGERPPPGSTAIPEGLVIATVYYLEQSFAGFTDEPAYRRQRLALADTPDGRELAEELTRRLRREPEVLKLRPTARSRLTAPA